MAFVVDASVVVKWVLDEPDSEAAVAVGQQRLLAPDLLDTECASVLWKAARRGELTPAEAEERLAIIAEADVERLPSAVLLAGAMRHALQLGHPVYDCLYIEAAARLGLPLVTADRRLGRLAPPGVQVIGLDDLP
ncbi:type II toxin-antitoxin system VapC family toxin [Falsiroseomonas sp. HW251]|uniref:type II toxin-antitoxin system VapC family toxin n=1 Tax=Falsiroseomonas sp. HW251 TaxID=3390998 RepID=UPI003D3228A5